MEKSRQGRIKSMEKFAAGSDYGLTPSKSAKSTGSKFVNPFTYWGSAVKSKRNQIKSSIRTRQIRQSKRGSKYIRTMRELSQ